MLIKAATILTVKTEILWNIITKEITILIF